MAQAKPKSSKRSSRKARGACTTDAPRTHAGTANLRPWKKGQSGNPGGRPKASYRISELARDHGEDALATLVSIMEGKVMDPVTGEPVTVDVKLRGDAARTILDRAYGKAASIKEHRHELGESSNKLVDALRKISDRPRIDIIDGEVREVSDAGDDAS